jgi:flagellar FliL protein
MNTILFISDDFRTSELLAALRHHFKGRVKLAPDFDQGLKDVFDNRPSGVFIQSEISGISGETVARHIKTLLRTEAPRIILVHTAPLKLQGGKKWFDDSLDFNLPAEELMVALKERILAISPDQWQDDDRDEAAVNPSASSAPADAGAEAVAPPDVATRGGDAAEANAGPSEDAPFEFEFNHWDVPVTPEQRAVSSGAESGHGVETADSLADEDEVFAVAHFESSAVEMSPAEDLPATSVSAAAGTETVAAEVVPPPQAPKQVAVTPAAKVEPADVSSRPAPSVADFSAPVDSAGKAARTTVPPLATTPPPAGKTIRIPLWLPLAAVLLVVASAAAYFLTWPKTTAPQKTVSAAPAPSTVVPVPAPAAAKSVSPSPLPSFIPAKGRDETFSRRNPGWERYRGNGLEFRLFREAEAVRAVQVIAVGKGGIAESLVTTVLRELTGSEDRTGPSRHNKDGYLVESAKTSAGGEIVVYRDKRGKIRGIVLSLS